MCPSLNNGFFTFSIFFWFTPLECVFIKFVVKNVLSIQIRILDDCAYNTQQKQMEVKRRWSKVQVYKTRLFNEKIMFVSR